MVIFLFMLLGSSIQSDEKGVHMNPIKKHKKAMLIGGICFAAFVWLTFFAWHISSTRIIADEELPDGTRFIMTQKLGEPFSTSCYYQKPGKPWGWYYYNHEDGYVKRATTQIDTEARQFSILRDGTTTVTFNWETETYAMLGHKPPRVFVGPQTWMPPNWQPPE